jgi:hypothetical protein
MPFDTTKTPPDCESDRAIPQFDFEPAFEHKEKIVRLVVLMPVERPLELSNTRWHRT